MSKLHDEDDKVYDPQEGVALDLRVRAVLNEMADTMTRVRALAQALVTLLPAARSLDTTDKFRGIWTKITSESPEPPKGPLWLCGPAPDYRVWLVEYHGPRQLESAVKATHWMAANVPLPYIVSAVVVPAAMPDPVALAAAITHGEQPPVADAS